MLKLRKPTLTLAKAVALSLLSLGLWCMTSGRSVINNYAVVAALERSDLVGARKQLNGVSDWNGLLRLLDTRNDPRLYQYLLDAQAAGWYRDFVHFGGAYPMRLDVVRHLIQRGARPEYKHLYAAAQVRATDVGLYLLDWGVPTCGKAGEGNALVRAADAPDPSLAIALIQHGADLNAPDLQPKSSTWLRPLEVAAFQDNQEVVRALMKHGADPLLPSGEPDESKLPIWKSIQMRTITGMDSKVRQIRLATWYLVKPVVEKKLGHTVTDMEPSTTVRSRPFSSSH